MEQINVSKEYQDKYKELIKAAQNVEAGIGGAQFKLYKMNKMREQIDVDLKAWWDKVSEEYKIDKNKDYYVTNEGIINLVERPVAPKAPAAPADPDKKPEAPAAPEAPKEAAPADNKEGGTAEDLK
jgi:hypothetical protein